MASKDENILFLNKCVESILNQTFKDFKFYIIIENNDSNIQYFKDLSINHEKVILLINDNAPGVSRARNMGFSQSESKYVAIIDSDDYYDLKKFEKQITILEENNNISLVGSNLFLVDFTDNIIGQRVYPENPTQIRKQFLYKMAVANPSVVIRRDDLDEVGYFDIDFNKAEDFELWLRFLVKNKKMYNIQEKLVYYRTTNDANQKRGPIHYNNYYIALKRHSKFIWPFFNRIVPLVMFYIIKLMPNNILSLLLKTNLNNRIKGIIYETKR